MHLLVLSACETGITDVRDGWKPGRVGWAAEVAALAEAQRWLCDSPVGAVVEFAERRLREAGPGKEVGLIRQNAEKPQLAAGGRRTAFHPHVLLGRLYGDQLGGLYR